MGRGGPPASPPCQRAPPDKTIPYLAACGRAYFTQAASLHPPFLAACLANGVLHKGKGKRRAGRGATTNASVQGICVPGGGGTDFEPGLLGSR